MRRFWLVVLIALAGGCSAASEKGEPSALSVTTTSVTASPLTNGAATTNPVLTNSVTSSAMPAPSAPSTADSETASTPVALVELGEGVWLMEDWEQPDRIVQADRSGTIQQILWAQDADVVGSFDAGHTVLCEDIDADGQLDLVDLWFSFGGVLKDTYTETRSVNGQVIEESSRPVDGANVPVHIHRICTETSSGPFIRITAQQWSAALRAAGFTDIAGDHAIDPVGEAVAKWNGVEYWPLNLYQGDFRPPANDETEIVECGLGAIEVSRNLPDNARTALAKVSRC